jgi:hypothetical protein
MSFFKSLITRIRKLLKSRPANPVDSNPAPGETIEVFNERRAGAREFERNYAVGERMEQAEDDNIA